MKPEIAVRLLDPQALVECAEGVVYYLKQRPTYQNERVPKRCCGCRNSPKLHLATTSAGELIVYGPPSYVKARDGDALLGTVTYRCKPNVFVWRGWAVAGVWDELVEVFQALGERCIYEAPEAKP